MRVEDPPRPTEPAPQYLLALEVIANAVRAAKHGSGQRKARVREEIAAGLLDYWVDAVSPNRHVRDAIMERLREVAARA